MQFSSDVGDVFRVPHELKAPNFKRLQVLMLKNNLQHGVEFNYKIVPMPDGSYRAFYNWKINRTALLAETLKKRGD